MMNVFFSNRGSTLIRKAKQFTQLVVVSGPDGKPIKGLTHEQARAQFAKLLEASGYAKNPGDTVAPGEGIWTTAAFSPIKLHELVKGMARLYLIGRAEWEESEKPEVLEVCRLLQAPKSVDVTAEQIIWNACL